MSDHQQLRDMLEAGALGALTDDEHARLDRHLADCGECASEMAAYHEALAAFGATVAPQPLAADRMARIRTRLVERAAAESAARPDTVALPLRARADARATAGNGRSGHWSGWIVAAGLAALLITHHGFHQSLSFGWLTAGVFAAVSVGLGAYALAQRDRLVALQSGLGAVSGLRGPSRAPRLITVALAGVAVGAATYAVGVRERISDLQERVAAVNAERNRVDARLREQAQTLAGLTGPSTRVIELAAVGGQDPSARMFWNSETNRWTFFAYDLPATPRGRTYQLWLVTDEQPISAGTFTPAPDGTATVEADYALSPEELRAVAVSQEPAGGVPAPTGPIVIAGNFES